MSNNFKRTPIDAALQGARDQFAVRSAVEAIAADPNDKRKAEDRPLRFDVSPQDAALIHQIIGRAVNDAAQSGFNIPITPALAAMDIISVHNHCGGLHLLRWLMAAPADFVNDFVGIAVNLDRRTARLMNGWKPIFTRGDTYQ